MAHEDSDPALLELAEQAGVAVQWRDAHGNDQTVAPDVLKRVLGALGIDAADDAAVAASLQSLRAENTSHCPDLITAVVRQPIEMTLPDDGAANDFSLELDIGGVVDGQYRRKNASTISLPGVSVPGYHRLSIGSRTFTLAVAPQRCFSMEDVAGDKHPRAWAVAVQVYGLRRPTATLGAPGGSGGVGDFTALAQMAEAAGGQGAAALAISPLHAMFSADPQRWSPYGPSSRLFLNVLHVDPAEVFGQPAVARAVAALNLGPELMRIDRLSLVDWPAVARARLAVLRHLFQGFPANVGTRLEADFASFRKEGGDMLEKHAQFEALHAWLSDRGQGGGGWRQWPREYQNPANDEVKRFAASHDQDVTFHVFLQWLADRGLARAQAVAREAGMSIGLISDLAVGTDPSGSHAWSRQEEILAQLSPGAPPDVYNPNGQAWGLTAFSPFAMKRNGFRAFIEMLRASLKHAGGIRVDHALGLSRMWLVPEGASPKEGAYVEFPFDDMMRLLALESWRHRCVVIGENLGTVPDGFNDRIAEFGMLGMQILWFERGEHDGGASFKRPADWSPSSVAMSTTHDLPTIAGWWNGTDIDWRTRLDLLGEGNDAAREQQTRERDKEALVQAMRSAGVMQTTGGKPDEAPVADALAYVGLANCPLVVVPAEDLLALAEQPNLPGTIDTHPNWRRRLPVDVEQMFTDKHVAERIKRLVAARKST